MRHGRWYVAWCRCRCGLWFWRQKTAQLDAQRRVRVWVRMHNAQMVFHRLARRGDLSTRTDRDPWDCKGAKIIWERPVHRCKGTTRMGVCTCMWTCKRVGVWACVWTCRREGGWMDDGQTS